MIRRAEIKDLDTIALFRYNMFREIGITDLLIDNFIEETKKQSYDFKFK